MDVTERKLAEESLSRMSQRLIEAQEQERRRIARDLHDDISQRLSLLGLHLQSCHNASTGEIKKSIEKAIQQISSLGKGVRTLSHRLHSANLEYLGLVSAVSGDCDELSKQHDVEIRFDSEDVPEGLPREVSLCLFRVAQEALQNAIKHSGSHHFRVTLTSRGNEIDLIVEDSGKGFEVEKAVRGLGLTSMRERLRLVNGRLYIDSQPGSGTIVHARVPLNMADWTDKNLEIGR
jgi:signal transduction histidine kinase